MSTDLKSHVHKLLYELAPHLWLAATTTREPLLSLIHTTSLLYTSIPKYIQQQLASTKHLCPPPPTSPQAPNTCTPNLKRQVTRSKLTGYTVINNRAQDTISLNEGHLWQVLLYSSCILVIYIIQITILQHIKTAESWIPGLIMTQWKALENGRILWTQITVLHSIFIHRSNQYIRTMQNLLNL